MNKKQLTVAWITGILIILNCISPPHIYYGRPERGHTIPVDTGRLLANIILLATIGGLLIYTLRNKKKVKEISIPKLKKPIGIKIISWVLITWGVLALYQAFYSISTSGFSKYTILYFSLPILSIIIGIGLLRLKNWAKSMLMIGCCVFLVYPITLLIISTIILHHSLKSLLQSIISPQGIVFFIFLALLGLFVFYLNSPSIKKLFSQDIK